MSEKTSIVHLYEYPLTKSEFSELPEDHQAALAILNYAVSEAHVFSRLYIAAAHELIGDDVIDTAAFMQRSVVLRSWSAKLFEAEEFLQLGGKKKRSTDKTLLELAERCLNDFAELREQRGHKVARDLRHEATSHYSFDAARKNLRFLADNANCGMYVHEQTGNSFYPLGDEVMFVARLNRHGKSLNEDEKLADLLNIWSDWNLSATKWLFQAHLAFVRELIVDVFGDKFAEKKSHWVPPKLYGTVDEFSVPLFLKKDG